LFGPAAVYAEPGDVRNRIEDFYTTPALYREQGERAGEIVEQRFSHQTHRARIEALIGRPAGSTVPISNRWQARPGISTGKKAARGRRRVLFMSSNGVGMGHLTRLLAIAKRLPPTIDPIFLTMSQAAACVQDFGYPVEYLPYHGYLGCDIRLWNHHLRRDLTERFAFYRPDAVIFDGNVPYDGLINAASSIPTCPLVWSRRAMWTEGAGRDHVWRERYFDVVIEPGEVAGDLDQGLTAEYRGKTRGVNPILLLDREDLLDRQQARVELGLAADRPACLIQLGAGNNFDSSTIRALILEALLQHPDLQIAWLDWAIAENEAVLPPSIKRIKTYPLARYLNAFDCAVSAAGYNAYHEMLSHGLPTLFVPNEHPMMDDQLARAFHADLRGLGLILRRRDHYRVQDVVARLLDPAEQAGMSRRCAELAIDNGAVEAARILDELVYTCRADLDPGQDIVPALRRFGG
ncbi:MAG: glycosyltransferase, partial [Geminicoccaceae bacterium]